MNSKIMELYNGFMADIHRGITEYYKENSNRTEMILKQACSIVMAHTMVYINIVRKYGVVFLINPDDQYSKDCLRALKKAGVRNISIMDIIGYTVRIECAAKEK